MPADVALVTEAKAIINQTRQHCRKMRQLTLSDAKDTRGLVYKQTGKFGKAFEKFLEEIAQLNAEFDKTKGESV